MCLTLYCLNSFLSFFGTYSKIGSFRLPTHSRDAHKNFFDDFDILISSDFKIEFLAIRDDSSHSYKGLNKFEIFIFFNSLLPEFFFFVVFRHIFSKIDSFVYRLLVATLIGNFLTIPSYFKIEYLPIRDEFVTQGHKRVKVMISMIK